MEDYEEIRKKMMADEEFMRAYAEASQHDPPLDVCLEKFLRVFCDSVPEDRMDPRLSEFAHVLLDQLEARNDEAGY